MKLFFILGFSLLSACAGIDKAMTGSGSVPTNDERTKSVSQFPELSEDQQAKFIAGDPWIGMSQAHLKAMWNNEPSKTQKKLTAKGNSEIQLYKVRVGDWKTGVKSKYYKVTMLENKVTELQELDESVGSLDNF